MRTRLLWIASAVHGKKLINDVGDVDEQIRLKLISRFIFQTVLFKFSFYSVNWNSLSSWKNKTIPAVIASKQLPAGNKTCPHFLISNGNCVQQSYFLPQPPPSCLNSFILSDESVSDRKRSNDLTQPFSLLSVLLFSAPPKLASPPTLQLHLSALLLTLTWHNTWTSWDHLNSPSFNALIWL